MKWWVKQSFQVSFHILLTFSPLQHFTKITDWKQRLHWICSNTLPYCQTHLVNNNSQGCDSGAIFHSTTPSTSHADKAFSQYTFSHTGARTPKTARARPLAEQDIKQPIRCRLLARSLRQRVMENFRKLLPWPRLADLSRSIEFATCTMLNS